jgi:hypothetical protein
MKSVEPTIPHVLTPAAESYLDGYQIGLLIDDPTARVHARAWARGILAATAPEPGADGKILPFKVTK